MTHKEAVTKIAGIIEANPGCQLNIDNDSWDITVGEKDEFLCKSDDFPDISSNWYAHGSNYGFLLSDTLIEMLNKRGVKVSAFAV